MKWSLVNRQGRVCHTAFPDQCDGLVSSAGHALIGISGKACRLRLRPAQLEIQAFAALSQLLQKAKPERIMISWFGEAWYDEVVPGSEMALERLIELMLAGQSVDRFYRRVRSLDSLEASHQLQPLIDLWRAYGVVDVRANAETIANRTNGKYLIVHQDTDAGHVKFCEFGKTKWAVYDSSRWMTKCIGQRVQDQPDYEYGCWTANAYRHAMLDSVPTLSDMDTLVLDATGGGHRRLQYIRLTLPVRGRDGSRQMLSTSCHDLSVDLRPPIH